MFNGANTGFMLLAASLVMLMTPGLAFFYGGLVGRLALAGSYSVGGPVHRPRRPGPAVCRRLSS